MDPKRSNYFQKLVQKNDSELHYMVNHPNGIKKEAYKVARYILDERKQVSMYPSYTYNELLEARNSINSEKYPARAHLLNEEIKSRDFDHEVLSFDFSDKPKGRLFTEKNTVNPIPSLRIRPDVKFMLQGETIDQLITISEEEFIAKLLHPIGQPALIVEDFNIHLYISFDTVKHEYGFKFRYFDKNLRKEYKSILHGISESFALQFVSDFIEKGKSELAILTWKEVHVSAYQGTISFFQQVFNYFVGAAMFFLILDQHFLGLGLYDIVFRFLFNNSVYIFIFTAFTMIIGIVKNRHQLMNLKKLSTNERIDTLVPIFMLPFFLMVFFLMKLSDSAFPQ